MNIHYKQHGNNEELNCIACNLKFINRIGLKMHIRKEHKKLDYKILNKNIKCSICNKWLSSKEALNIHMKTHLPVEDRIKTCPVCKKLFVNL